MTHPSSPTTAKTQTGADNARAGWTRTAERLARKATYNVIAADPHFQEMKPRARRLVKVLIAFHVPATGHTERRTKNETLRTFCDCSVSTIVRARHDAIAAGFIVGYAPGDGGRGVGDGGWAGRYTVARTPEEAAEARALRLSPDAPYWPAIPDRTPAAAPGADIQKQEDSAPRKRPGRPRKQPVESVSSPAPQPLPSMPDVDPEELDDSRQRGVQSLREQLRPFGGIDRRAS